MPSVTHASASTSRVTLRELAGDRLACGHFNDTRGLGIANVMAALLAGETRFDSCLGGIGGCPHAPGASAGLPKTLPGAAQAA